MEQKSDLSEGVDPALAALLLQQCEAGEKELREEEQKQGPFILFNVT